MTSTLDKQYLLISHLQTIFSEVGLPTKLEMPTSDDPFHTLIVQFGSIGVSQYIVNLQLMFLPKITFSQAENDTYILQSFFELSEQVNSSISDEVLWLIARLNTKLPLGAFGLLSDDGVLYFKHNLILDAEIEKNLFLYSKLIQRQLDMLLHILNSFMDTLMQVAEGKTQARVALQQNRFASLFL